jgi:hypothetical protein
MSEPALLSPEKHGKLRVAELTDFTCFKSQHLVPVVFQEFYGLATEFPLVFVRNSTTADLVPVALMGLSKGKNLYCQTPQWTASFVPTSFTLAPFSIHRTKEGSDEAVIVIDEGSPLVSESQGEALYSDTGEQSDFLKKRIEHVVTITRQSLQAIEVCKLLADMKLLKSRPIKLQLGPNTPAYELDGVFMVDEEALEKLDDAQFNTLRKRGILPLIYSHLTSLQILTRLTRLQLESDAAVQPA